MLDQSHIPDWLIEATEGQQDYSKQRKFGDSFMPEVSALLGQALIMPAPEVEDCNHNTDLIVLGMNSVRIACRIRKNEDLIKYGTEFTIRCRSQNGGKTELPKVLEGWGDYMFYGFASKCEKHLARWTIINLEVFRKWYVDFLFENSRDPGFFKANSVSNPNDKTAFRAFDLLKMPEEIILACNWDINRNKAA